MIVNESRSIIYTPQTNYVGPDSFTYKCKDVWDESNVAVVNIQVVNRAPTPAADYLVKHFKNIGMIDVMNNDTDPDGDV
ncbi:Ig-like domain-containing protein, partial [Klebsiella quasipneumoniae]|uniref:Ig-like domain-containing protein n=1 Tax=Klebsiella quasipneumoniae TaxID=1463165 RepID=UPI002A4E2E81